MKAETSNLKPSDSARVSEEEALQRGMAEKSKEFMESGTEVYAEA